MYKCKTKKLDFYIRLHLYNPLKNKSCIRFNNSGVTFSSGNLSGFIQSTESIAPGVKAVGIKSAVQFQSKSFSPCFFYSSYSSFDK